MLKHRLVRLILIMLLAVVLLGARFHDQTSNTAVSFCAGKKSCAGKYSNIANIRVLQQSGARPSFSYDGKEIVFDQQNNDDGYFDVYIMDTHGKILHSVTDNNPGINQRNNGNAVFSHDGKYIVFMSEEQNHYGSQVQYLGNPGLGYFCNLWAATPDGSHFWKLTDIPLKKGPLDPTPIMGTLNPHFSPDGSKLVWSERYDNGGQFNWGKWRIEMGDWSETANGPTLTNVTTVFTPTTGNYVTAMGFVNPTTLVLSGNLSGQPEYGMDQYTYDLHTKTLVDLQNSPNVWEEDASVTPHGHIVYMTNYEAKDKLNFNSADWTHQPREREWWIMGFKGKHKTRLTYFNDSKAPEYLHHRIIVASSDISSDGRYLVGTLGVDFGSQTRANVDLKVVLIQFKKPI